jgi:hypothetical protein
MKTTQDQQSDATLDPYHAAYEKLRTDLSGHLRFAVIAWVVALPALYAAIIWSKISGALPNANWWSVALFPVGTMAAMLGGAWLAASSSLKNFPARYNLSRKNEAE